METNANILQAIFDHATLGIAQISLDGSWLRVNDQFCQMLGYSEAELRRKTLRDITYPEHIDESLAGRRRLLAGEISSHTIEKRFIRKDGSVLWGRLNRSLVRDQDSQPQYFIAVVEDLTEKKQVERALLESERRFMLAQDAAGLSMWDHNMSTNELVMSGPYKKLYGLASDDTQLTYKGWLALIHPEDRERVLGLLLRDTATQTQVIDREFRVVWPNGSVHWMLAKGTIFCDEFGRAVRATGVNLDITDRKRAEEALRESEERFRQLAENIRDLFWLKTPDLKRVIYFSPSYDSISGRKREDAYRNPNYQDFLARIVDEDRPRMTEFMDRPVEAEFEIEFRIKHPDGSVHWVCDRGFPIRDQSGKIYRVAGITHDVTESKLAEKALRESEERFRNMADTSPVMIWVAGQDKTLTFFNKSWLTFVGRSIEQELYNGWTENVHPDDLDGCLASYSAAFDARRNFEIEERLRRADGEYRWVLCSGIPRFERDGAFAGYIGSTIDITDLKRTQGEAPAGVATYDWNLRENVGHGSREFNPLYGLPPSDIGPSIEEWLQLIHPEDRERVQAEREQTRQGGDPCDSEFRVVWPDGTVHWLLAKGKLLRDSEGKPIRMVGVNMDITERKRAEVALVTSRNEIRALASNLLTAQEDEHRKLSREVHDQICQDLASIAIELGGCAAEPPLGSDMAIRLKSLQARVIQAAGDARHIALQLHSPVLDDLGLVIALRELCKQGSDRAPGIAFEFKSDALPEIVPPEVASCVYHVAHESIQNIAKHSRARHAWIALTCPNRTIVLTISDDGIGFDPRVTRGNGGLGLIGMEERVRSVNGKLTITAQPISGTRVALEVPMTE